jgi:hypothetical protein
MAQVPSGQKFHTVPSNVQTEEKGSKLANSQREIFTMQDIVDTTRPYKVFTALLTQSGGDNPQSTCSDDIEPLVIGITYFISLNDGTGDFTNVGAPNNEVGTYFVATGTTPNSWGSSGNVCLQFNQGAPVATVLENTIGNIYFMFDGDGYYFLNGDNLFISNSWTPTIMILNDTAELMDGQILTINKANDSQYLLQSYNQSGGALNGQFYNTPIEIRVYE